MKAEGDLDLRRGQLRTLCPGGRNSGGLQLAVPLGVAGGGRSEADGEEAGRNGVGPRNSPDKRRTTVP